ncbi:MAG: hypothetical protein ACTS1Z_01640 [Parasphingopyxis sp.]|uniref:hypothetical protein n=1 Tax=Parasphingopyxis sp. TaxID=1920299 RepID=UPI003FA164ED
MTAAALPDGAAQTDLPEGPAEASAGADSVPGPPPGTPVADPQTETVANAAERSEAGTLFSLAEIELTWVILLFGIFSLVAFYRLVKSDNAAVSIHAMRMYVVIILVFGTLLVVSSAYHSEQIAPVVGFFGTIAGYLLGRAERKDAPQ